MIYFLLHDAETYRRRIAPAFATSWRFRAFQPVVELAQALAHSIHEFSDRYRLTKDEQPLLIGLSAGQSFDRRLWRHLAGEALLYGSADAPAIQTAEESLIALLGPKDAEFVRQAHHGSRDVEFNGVPYRPGNAGLNETDDVARLAKLLTLADSSCWDSQVLPTSHDLSEDDIAEELEYARECLVGLAAIYAIAQRNRWIVICEDY